VLSPVEDYLSRRPLLAKWRREREDFSPGRGFNFVWHYKEVLWALGVLFTEPYWAEREYPSLAHAVHARMELPCSFRDFKAWTLLSLLGHDFGKAGGEFQEMLVGLELAYKSFRGPEGGFKLPEEERRYLRLKRRMSGYRKHVQAYRHELLSALMMNQEPLRSWVVQIAGGEQGFAYALAGAFGHHLKCHRPISTQEILARGRYKTLPVYQDKLARDMNTVLRSLPEGFRDLAVPAFPDLPHLPGGNHFTTPRRLEQGLQSISVNDLFYRIEDDPISGAIKWLTILADTLGSIHASGDDRSYRKTKDAILSVIRETWATREVDFGAILRQRLGPEGSLTPTQKNCLRPGRDLFLPWATGVGKTLGALQWGSGHPKNPMIFCTPTMDIGTHHFLDYARKGMDTLRHSRAGEVLLKYTPTPEDNSQEEADARREARDTLHRIRQGSRDLTFATIDQVLGLIAFRRSAIAYLPWILKSQIVFDEVENYDPVTRAWLIRFLNWFPQNRKAFLSATFPEYLLDRLRPTLRAPTIMGSSTNPDRASNKPRYRIHILKGPKEAFQQFHAGTLWFTNTVARCQQVGITAPDALVYHSRFRDRDRRGISDRIKQDLLNKRRVTTTQVAEVARDISALSLLSEISTPSSMTQRLGRSNRHDFTGPVDVFFYMPQADNGLPYVAHDDWLPTFNLWRGWIGQFDGLAVSQDELNEALLDFYRDPRNFPRQRDAFSSLLVTSNRRIRDADYTTRVLLPEDAQKLPDHEETKHLTIPILLRPDQKTYLETLGRTHRKILVVDSSIGTYDIRLGFLPS